MLGQDDYDEEMLGQDDVFKTVLLKNLKIKLPCRRRGDITVFLVNLINLEGKAQAAVYFVSIDVCTADVTHI